MATTPSLPVGPEVPSHPSPLPTRTTIRGHHVTLVPLSAHLHASSLYTQLEPSPSVWTYMPVGPFPDLPSFSSYLSSQASSTDPFFFAVIPSSSSSSSSSSSQTEPSVVLGFLSLLNISPSTRSVEIGNITFSPALQRTTAATEALYLLMRYCMQDLQCRRLEWKCDSLNAKSRRAAIRLGFVYEGLFRQHRIVKGRNRDTAWFSIIDGDEEWGAVNEALERWLDGGNFEDGGRQRRKLEDIRGEILEGRKKEKV